MKINKIKAKKNKYEILFDNGETLTTYDELMIKYNILYHKEIDEKTITNIKKENSFYETYNSIITYINKRYRSEFEVKEYLKKYELSPNEINKIIEKLKTTNLLNDVTFTKAYINDKLNFTNIGPNKIRKELQGHQIEETIINNVFNKIDDELFKSKIKKIIAKKIQQNKKYANNILKQKIMFDLINQGYAKEMILEELNKANLKNDITSIYNKYYNKYSLKYTGYELDFYINQKLYALGYTKDDIDNAKNNLWYKGYFAIYWDSEIS